MLSTRSINGQVGRTPDDFHLGHGPIANAPITARFPSEQQSLLSIVVDCEEEFDWRYPVRGTPYTCRSIPPLYRLSERMAAQDAPLTILATYPIIKHEASWRGLMEMRNDHGAVIGAHLHPWVTPPFVEKPTLENSYQGNLPPEIEAEKIETLLRALADRGSAATLFRAGRYGFGTSTADFLASRGIIVDLSFMPHFDYGETGGMSFTGVTCDPFWFSEHVRLFEVPMTAGFIGSMRGWGVKLFSRLNSPAPRSMRLPSMLANSGLLNRVRLSPEGVTLAEAKALTRILYAQGHRAFHLSFHSSSLVPGSTPYVTADAGVSRLVEWLEQFVHFFQQEFGGRVVTPDVVEAASREASQRGQPDILELPIDGRSLGAGATSPGPRVSVIIPTYNRADLVGRAVRSAVEQSYPLHQIIIVDDGSSDDTRAALAPYLGQVCYIYQENQGVSGARNRGIQEATGDLVAFLDSDDVWEPWKIEMQVACLKQFPDLTMLGTNAWTVSHNGEKRSDFIRTYSVYKLFERVRSRFSEQYLIVGDRSGTLYFGDFSSPMFLGNFFLTSTVIVRRDVLQRAGAFDLEMRNAGEDYDLFWRISELGPVGVIDIPAARFRRGGIDHLHSSPEMALSNLRAINRFLQSHPDGPSLATDLIDGRLAESYAWAGLSLFDHDRPVEAKPFLRQAIKRGSGTIRIRIYEFLTLMPGWTIPAARRLAQNIKKAMGYSNQAS